MKFERLAIVNRGEPAMRLINAVRDHNLEFGSDLRTIALYTDTDRDAMFVHDFDRTLKAAGVGVVKTPFRAPNANAHAERWVLSVSRECLDHLILFGLHRLRHVVHCYRVFFNEHRPHQGIGNRIPGRCATGAAERAGPSTGVVCEEFLGGLLKSYSRKAA